MSLSRRHLLSGSAAGAVALSSGLASPALAQSGPIKIGYLPALTGPSSSTGVGMTRGTELAVSVINAAGGINGRQIELVVRDTQSDPTKAVNAVAELAQRARASIIWGPLNSGEALAATPLISRQNIPMLHPCWVDELIDVRKYPMAFRSAPTNTQVGSGANHYVVDVLKLKKVAVISDTTGYGTASVNTYVPMLRAKGAEVVYSGHVDAANPDLRPELVRMRNAGAEAIMPWSVNAGFLSRILNARGAMGWDVPVVGQTTLGSGQTRALLEKPEYWNKVYSNNFKNCCYVNGQLPPSSADFLERLKRARVDFSDTLLWWVAAGWDGMQLMADALRTAGTKPQDIVAHWHKVNRRPGVYGTISWSPQQHNGFLDEEVVMCEVNSLRDGAFNLAPGYSA